MRTNRRFALIAALVLISIPALLAVGQAASFYARNATNGSIISSGEKREYLLYVPRSYDASKPTALVFSFHAAGLWAAAQMETSQWNRVADEAGFLVVYPNGRASDGVRIWHVERSPQLAEDVAFISDLIDTLSARYNIDAKRIYANGLSNGGGMSFVLSCTLSQRIAAVGLVGSALTLPFEWCGDGRPVPVIAFHGTADPVTPYYGGKSWVSARAFPAVPGFIASWAAGNRCHERPEAVRIASDVIRQSYTGCANRADVVLYAVQDGGHTWPGGTPLPEWFTGTTTTSVDASRELWRFFSAHRGF